MTRVLALVLAVAVVSSQATATSGTTARGRTGDCRATKRPQSRFPRTFFPPRLARLWLPLHGRCVYLVPPHATVARPIWRVPTGEEAITLQWAPDARSFVVATSGRRIYRVDRRGRVGAVYDGSAAAFVADGSLAIFRTRGISFVHGRSSRSVATKQRLDRVAGFRGNAVFLGEDVLGHYRGYGHDAVAVSMWRGRHNVLLVVDRRGRIRRASAVDLRIDEEGHVGGWSWAPDGMTLYELSVVASPRGFPKDHDHCLDRGTFRMGFRRMYCTSSVTKRYQFHFDKLVWTRSGRRGLLDNGTMIGRNGSIVGHLDASRAWGAFAVHWAPQD